MANSLLLLYKSLAGEEKKVSRNEWNDCPEVFKDDISAYVLVTCGQVSSDGKIQVEMTYEGDPAVISYLLTKARDSLDES